MLPFNEYLDCDVNIDNQYVELSITSSKMDVYRDGNIIVLANTGHTTCPFNIPRRYVHMVNIVSSDLMFNCTLHFSKAIACYTFRLEFVKQCKVHFLSYITVQWQLAFIASGQDGKSPPNAAINDTLFKRHGW